MGRFDEAELDYERALGLDPSNAGLQDDLKMVKEQAAAAAEDQID